MNIDVEWDKYILPFHNNPDCYEQGHEGVVFEVKEPRTISSDAENLQGVISFRKKEKKCKTDCDVVDLFLHLLVTHGPVYYANMSMRITDNEEDMKGVVEDWWEANVGGRVISYLFLPPYVAWCLALKEKGKQA